MTSTKGPVERLDVEERKALAQYIAQRSMMPPGVVERELADLTVAELTIVEIERRQNARTQHRVDYELFARAYQS